MGGRGEKEGGEGGVQNGQGEWGGVGVGIGRNENGDGECAVPLL